MSMNLPKKVKIREVGTRDGFQSWPDLIPTEQKIKVVESIIEAGVKEVETTSFVSPKAVPQLSDAAKVMAGVPRGGGVTHCVLVPNLRGAQMAVEAKADQIMVVISASEPHNLANFNRTIETSFSDLEPIFQLAKDNGIEVFGGSATSFGCPYQGEVPEADVLKIVDKFMSLGVDYIALADTTGLATPTRVDRLVSMVKDSYPDIEIMLHFHNNRGNAMANLLQGLIAGASIFDTALAGIGGCPNVPQASGNLATEDVVYLLDDMGVETGINQVAIIQAALELEKMLGKMLPGQVMKSGPRDPKLANDLCGVH